MEQESSLVKFMRPLNSDYIVDLEPYNFDPRKLQHRSKPSVVADTELEPYYFDPSKFHQRHILTIDEPPIREELYESRKLIDKNPLLNLNENSYAEKYNRPMLNEMKNSLTDEYMAPKYIRNYEKYNYEINSLKREPIMQELGSFALDSFFTALNYARDPLKAPKIPASVRREQAGVYNELVLEQLDPLTALVPTSVAAAEATPIYDSVNEV